MILFDITRIRVDLLPVHMRRPILDWLLKAEPHPNDMGTFFFAVLTNRFVEAFLYADDANLRGIRGWANFLHNEMPSDAWGSKAKLLRWYESKHANVN